MHRPTGASLTSHVDDPARPGDAGADSGPHAIEGKPSPALDDSSGIERGQSTELRRSQIHEWIAIIRPRQYAKQVLLLVGAGLAWWTQPDPDLTGLVGKLLLGTVAASLAASSNYVLNEILDASTDRHHPRKRNRPLVGGRVQVSNAYGVWIVLGIAGLAAASALGRQFLWVTGAFLGLAALYNVPPVRLKDLPYVDVIVEALNSPVRLLMGWFIVAPTRLPAIGLLIAAWMAGAVAMAGKRVSELDEFDHQITAAAYRRSFAHYTRSRLMISLAIYLVISFVFGIRFILG